MLKASLVFDNDFWKTLEYLDNLAEEVRVCELLPTLCVSEKCLFDVISFLEEFDYKVAIKKRKNKRILVPNPAKPRVKLDLSFAHWIALQTYFPLLIEQAKTFYPHEIIDKLLEYRKEHPRLDLFRVLDGDKQKKTPSSRMSKVNLQAMIASIEEGLEKRKGLLITLVDGKKIKVYPRQLIYLDGELSIVGEDVAERCLVYLALRRIKQLDSYNLADYQVNFSYKTVNDFIRAIRLVSGREERIVLKIYANKDVDLSPPYHFLSNPFIASNPEGDLIWAACVEISSAFFRWLHSIEDDMEILDPESLKKEFTRFGKQKKEVA